MVVANSRFEVGDSQPNPTIPIIPIISIRQYTNIEVRPVLVDRVNICECVVEGNGPLLEQY